MQVAVGDRRVQQLGQCDRLLHAVGDMITPPPARMTGNFASASSARRLVERCFVAGAAADADRLRNLDLDVAVEEVARNVQLRRAHLEQRAVEAARP